jgi:hypothetical protein
MVESASINKSLFVLAQCVEAIGKKQHRIPYRESKMTRILSLGQNNGLTVMILNLAPMKSYHLDTLSSLNFANRTKKIEVREVENEPMFKGPPRPLARLSVAAQRQPLRPLTASANVNLTAFANKDKDGSKTEEKPMKAFHVYSDKPRPRNSTQFRKPEPPKRPSLDSHSRLVKPSRIAQPYQPLKHQEDLSAAKIEEMVEKKVEEILAVRAVSEKSRQTQVRELNEQVQKRLETLEQRIEGTEDARAEGLSFLLMAKQHQARGEDNFALKMYQLALPFFPNNEKLTRKIATLKGRIQSKSQEDADTTSTHTISAHKREFGSILSIKKQPFSTSLKRQADHSDGEYNPEDGAEEPSDDDIEEITRVRRNKRTKTNSPIDEGSTVVDPYEASSPRTIHLLSVINSRDVRQIKLLKGVGVKKAEAIVDCLCEMDQHLDDQDSGGQVQINSLAELSKLKGVGVKSVESMRNGVLV